MYEIYLTQEKENEAMSRELVFDYSKTAGFIREEEIVNMKKAVLGAKEVLTEKTGAGNDFLGWIDLPVDYDKDEFDRIKKAAEKIKGDSDVLLVIGIGGSYLGARAAIEFLSHSFYNVLPTGDLFCRQQHQQQIYQGPSGRFGRKRFLHQYHLQIRYDNGTGHCIPRVQGYADQKVRQGGGQ